MDNSAILELAKAWPALSTLRLGSNGSRAVSRITLRGLDHIIKHCRDLRSLSIVINAQDPPTVLDDMPTCCNKRITTINFADSLLSNPSDVVAYLSVLFPGLVEIQTHRNLDMETKDLWRQVTTMIPAMRRAHEARSRLLELESS
ncbi:hypothetical protein PHLCEN_2v11860 [Hermanssonia centrifuga]|uniref:Uncharacterized protein n=1 Tax=Hermanssonia centrifuga TaxID=98765 RepID=A0A2R6NJ46_9APHY|nr:hypothetical protein PHLCEN_2v11860 [Hermanssonia centrifuga]